MTETFCRIPVQLLEFITPPSTEERSIVMTVSVCLFVCLFVRPGAYLRSYTSDHHQIFVFVRVCVMAMTRSSFGSGAIFYALPVYE